MLNKFRKQNYRSFHLFIVHSYFVLCPMFILFFSSSFNVWFWLLSLYSFRLWRFSRKYKVGVRINYKVMFMFVIGVSIIRKKKVSAMNDKEDLS